MSRSWIASLSAMLLLPATAFAGDLRQDANAIFSPVTAVAAQALVKGNDITAAKVELGKKLFFDPRLSRSQAISCNSCHNLGTGGVDAGPTSLGHAWARGGRRAPTVLNAVFNASQFWDGRSPDLHAQAKGPVQADVEMNNTPAVVEQLIKTTGYAAEFQKAFPGDSNPGTFDNFAKAIEAFEATLITPNSKFDKFLLGDASALNDKETKGLRLFIDKGCAACHSGVNLGGNSFHTFGAVAKPSAEILPVADKGRHKVTGAAGDEYAFRVAPLRNVALRSPYFHSASVWTLEEAVDVMAKSQLGATLTPEENGAIVAFLGALTGDQPKVDYPVLPPRTKDAPRP